MAKPPLIAIPAAADPEVDVEEIQTENQTEKPNETRGPEKQKTVKKSDKRPGEDTTTTDHLFVVNSPSDSNQYADIFFVNDLVQTKLPIGQEIRVTVVDKSMLDEKMISVYERFHGYSKFYKRLNNLVDSIAEGQQIIDFLPAEGQLVLAPYKSKYYRAVALQSDYDNDKVHLFYLDFGNIDVVKRKKIKNFPVDLLFNYCCNLCHLQFDDADKENLTKLIQTKRYIKIDVIESNSEFTTAVWKKP